MTRPDLVINLTLLGDAVYSIEFTSENACSKEPATISVSTSDGECVRVHATIEPEKGADGHYPVIKFKQVE